MGKAIERTFRAKFQETFERDHPNLVDVTKVFNWLKNEASNARYFEHLEKLDDLRREAEIHFSKFEHLKKKVNRTSQKVNEEIKKRDERLRTTKTKGKIPIIEGERERVPPRK